MKTTFCLIMVFMSVWALESDPDVAFAQDRKPAVWSVYGVRRAEAIDSRRIRLTIGHASNAGVLGVSRSYRIVSEDDPYYAYKRFVTPVKAVLLNKGKETELTAPKGAAGGMQVFNRYLVELQLPKPMVDGMAYSVVCLGDNGKMVSSARTAATLVFRDGRFVRPLEVKSDRKALTVMGLRGANHVGNGIVRLEFGAAFSPEAGKRLESYRITIDGRPAKVLKMGRRSKIDAYLPVGWPFRTILMHEIFLQLDAPLPEGASVRIQVSPEVCSGADETGFTFSSLSSFSDSIKVNQVGYLAELSLKRAYLGRWLGSFPEQDVDKEATKPAMAPFALGFDEPPSFSLVDVKNGDVVFRGKAVFAHNGLEPDGRANHSAENVYYLDFDDFKTPGRYFISVEGVGRSLEFAIDDDVYQDAFKMAAHGVFLQRCGMELGPPWTTWRRIACHADGVIATTQERIRSKEFINPANQLMVKDLRNSSKEDDGKRKDTPRLGKLWARNAPLRLNATGGHHDAGDYNPRSHLDVAQNLMDAYEIAPNKFHDGQLDIPENRNGIPDIVDEALWALRLWIGLQDDDGGVFNGTESDGDPNFIQSAELDPKGDFAWAKDCKGSFLFAGAMSQASRILGKLGRKEKAADFIARARRAYEWGCGHKPATENSKLYREYAVASRAYAAAQLYHATGVESYHHDFKECVPWLGNPSARMIPADNSYDLSLAVYAYSMIPDAMADLTLKNAVIRALEEEADMYVEGSRKMAYKFIRHPYAPINWGTGAYEHFLVPVWHAWGVTRLAAKRKEYFEWMVRTADNTLGANPLNISWIVGLGERTIRAPLHNSRYNPTGMCMPGMQAQGPNGGGKVANYCETAYPPHDNAFATLHAFVDCHWAISMDEGTVNHQAETMAAFGLLLKDSGK